MTPTTRINEARKNFLFAALQWAAMMNGRFQYNSFPNGFNWTIEGETRFISCERSEKGFRTQVTNQLRAALALLVIETDSVLTDCFDKYPYRDTNDERRAARCIIYMLRCAFAHHPLEPTWNITSDNYKDKTFNVPSINFTLNTTGLHGKTLDVEGLNWFKILDLIDLCTTYIDD